MGRYDGCALYVLVEDEIEAESVANGQKQEPESALCTTQCLSFKKRQATCVAGAPSWPTKGAILAADAMAGIAVRRAAGGIIGASSRTPDVGLILQDVFSLSRFVGFPDHLADEKMDVAAESLSASPAVDMGESLDLRSGHGVIAGHVFHGTSSSKQAGGGLAIG
ncbi:hypothetical protein CH63R_13989 [Colletotrichum higginsianum IMI 349063]|uniref:Uncharacterized protein n=1 Tax=Colletotrichum higginsianum (strain IMI 349063) TaxID=759273 RepID=A0A1B7XSL6_COLHI|nr:hypothetical protein CH63R_13989 [Colletotrichum higginsianum IMI 349063]OBR02763.1 hypothetical protein CH63R_13989 [Colletotrichum higginsianum IMI 349063]